MSNPPDRAGDERRKYRQLPLFVQAGELHSEAFNKGDHDEELDGVTHDEFMENKLSEATHNGMVKNIQKQGVQSPVKVDWDKDTVIDGHHRIASANSIDPKMWLPVQSVTPNEYWGDSGDMSVSDALRSGPQNWHEDNEKD